MAESAISLVVQRLSDLLTQKAEFLQGVRGQVEWLRDELQRMQCFLKHADAKQEDDKRFQNWVSEIRNAAYDAEDIIDTYILKVESQKRRGFVKRYGRIVKNLVDLHKVGIHIESFKERIHDISRSCESYGIKNVGEWTSSASRERLRQLRRSSPRGVEKDVVGMERNTAQLMARVLTNDSPLAVISAVGPGGIGKTTLVKIFFNNADVRGHFDCQAWVYVSQEHRTKDILQGIVKDMIQPTKEPQEMTENSDEAELEKMLYEHLQGKRYLVVLDDVWTKEAWDILKRSFPDTNNGSRVLLTTRNKNIALHADAESPPFELCPLTKEESWELFSRKAFNPCVDGSSPSEFEEIGRKIAGRCGGLPLATIVIGGILSRKRRVSEWERVLNNIDSHFAEGENGVFSILALSYTDLPHYLKSCFLHLSLFPENCTIPAKKLFQLWIAEGLIPRQGERMEDIAEDYLNELIDRNMVQVITRSANKRVKECQVHVLRGLSIFKAKEEIFLEILGKTDCHPSVRSRHLVIHSNSERYFSSKLSTPSLRSLLLFHPNDPACSMELSQLDTLCRRFKLLRVLDLENMRIGYLSTEVGKLINLRYLCLKNTGIKKLPSSSKYLRSLLTLDLSGDVPLYEAPNAICKMENLQHLYMNPCNAGQLRFGILRHLQTLKQIHIDNWKPNKSGNVSNLRKLGITVHSYSDIDRFFNSVARVEHLESLHLFSTGDIQHLPQLAGISHLQSLTKLSMFGRMGMVPSPDEFPQNLTQLTLHGSFLNISPIMVLKRLPKLSILKLREQSYTGNHMLISANGFPKLKFLELQRLFALDELAVEEGAMPKLRHLRISGCRELAELPPGMKFLSGLKELEISKMPSAFVSKCQGRDFHKVQHIPSISYT